MKTQTKNRPASNGGTAVDRTAGVDVTKWRELLRSPTAWGFLGVAVIVLVTYFNPLSDLAHRWLNEPDYSHGFLVPVFSAVLLWVRRDMLPRGRLTGSWWGIFLFALGGAMRFVSAYFFYTLIDALSLLPTLAGIALLLGGSAALRWAWPSILFLIFMIPLPSFIAGTLSHPLQHIATTSSTWLLQTAGLPAVARGNVIALTHGEIGVVEACSGLRMLMLFLAITVGASFLVERPLWEKLVISVSALAIGLLTNIFRITVTAILYEYVGADLAEKVFHDLAGWLMMPTAMLLLMLELYVMSKLLVTPTESGPLLMH